MEWCLTQRSKLLKAELTTRNALLVLNANINWTQPILLMGLIMKSIVLIAIGKNYLVFLLFFFFFLRCLAIFRMPKNNFQSYSWRKGPYKINAFGYNVHLGRVWRQGQMSEVYGKSVCGRKNGRSLRLVPSSLFPLQPLQPASRFDLRLRRP